MGELLSQTKAAAHVRRRGRLESGLLHELDRARDELGIAR
jgi:hypothetical protein